MVDGREAEMQHYGGVDSGNRPGLGAASHRNKDLFPTTGDTAGDNKYGRQDGGAPILSVRNSSGDSV